MNGCFHWWRHERSPYQYIGLQCFHCKCWVTCCDSQLLLQILETFVMYWWFVIFMFWKSVFVFSARTNFPEHRHPPDWLDHSYLAEGSSSHSTGCATPDSWVSTSPSPNSLVLVLPSVNLYWKSLLVLSLTSESWSDQKENNRNGWKRTSRNS